MLPVSLKPLLLSAAASAVLLTACQKPSIDPADNQPNVRPLTDGERNTVNSANDFAFRAFGALRGKAPADNMCISPLSISAALTMAYNGAEGSTKADMKQTLGFAPQTDTEINQSFQSLFVLLRGIDRQVTFTTANSIWYGQQYQLQAPFVQQNQTYFNAHVQGVNFASSLTKNIINSWVSTETHGKIPSILNSTDPGDVM